MSKRDSQYHLMCSFYPRLGSAGDRIFRGVDSNGIELLLVPNRYRRTGRDPEFVMLGARGTGAAVSATPVQGRFGWGEPRPFGTRKGETGLEAAVRRILQDLGIRFDEQVALPGTPDFLLPDYHVVVNAHGCFWHGHSCDRGASGGAERIGPKIQRDALTHEQLMRLGFRIVTVWECGLIGQNALSSDEIGLQLIDFVEGTGASLSIPREFPHVRAP
jgi:DNA mismatch endonuclease (patch repair protein)